MRKTTATVGLHVSHRAGRFSIDNVGLERRSKQTLSHFWEVPRSKPTLSHFWEAPRSKPTLSHFWEAPPHRRVLNDLRVKVYLPPAAPFPPWIYFRPISSLKRLFLAAAVSPDLHFIDDLHALSRH